MFRIYEFPKAPLSCDYRTCCIIFKCIQSILYNSATVQWNIFYVIISGSSDSTVQRVERTKIVLFLGYNLWVQRQYSARVGCGERGDGQHPHTPLRGSSPSQVRSTHVS